jgi:hypothetical protein
MRAGGLSFFCIIFFAVGMNLAYIYSAERAKRGVALVAVFSWAGKKVWQGVKKWGLN